MVDTSALSNLANADYPISYAFVWKGAAPSDAARLPLTEILTKDASGYYNMVAPAASTGATQSLLKLSTPTDAANNALEIVFEPIISGGTKTAIEARREGATSGAHLGFTTGGNLRWTMTAAGHQIAADDNAYDICSASKRARTIYAGTGTINTSDAREKNWRGGLTAAEMRSARTISDGIGIFQFKDGKRDHCGVKAQAVIAALEAEDLDPFAYAFVCYDEWHSVPAIPAVKEKKSRKGEVVRHAAPAQPGKPAGDRYGIRADELNFFLAAALNQRLAALEAK